MSNGAAKVFRSCCARIHRRRKHLEPLCENCKMWRSVSRRYCRTRKRIPPDPRHRMMSVVDDLYLLMEKLRLAKADILGYSMGGRLALSFAEKYPRKVRKLILESSSPGLKTEEERKARRERDEKLAAFIEEKGIVEFVNYWENIPLFESQKNLPASVRKKMREQRLRNSPAGLAASLRGMGTGAQPSWWDELEHLEVETLLITGSLDEFCHCGAPNAENFRACRHGLFPVYHAIHVEDCKKFVTIVREFLSDASLAGGE